MSKKEKEKEFEELEKKFDELPENTKIISPSEIIQIAFQIDQLMGELENRLKEQLKKLEKLAIENKDGEIKIREECKELLNKYNELCIDTIKNMVGSDASHILKGY